MKREEIIKDFESAILIKKGDLRVKLGCYSTLLKQEICKCENSSWNRDAGCMVCDDCNKII